MAWIHRNAFFSSPPHPRCARERMHQRLRRMPRNELLLWLCPLISSQCHPPRPIRPCFHHSHGPGPILSNMGDTGSFFSRMFVWGDRYDQIIYAHMYWDICGPHITPGHGLTWHILSLSLNAGYGGRIMMHANAYDLNGFLLQICCISLAPAFFSAAIYFCLSKMYVLPSSN